MKIAVFGLGYVGLSLAVEFGKIFDAILIAVGHREYCNSKLADWEKMLKPNGEIIDEKSLHDSKMFNDTSLSY